MDQKKRKREAHDDEFLLEMEEQLQPWWSVEQKILEMIEQKMNNKPPLVD